MKKYLVPENVMDGIAAFLQRQEPVQLLAALKQESEEYVEPKPTKKKPTKKKVNNGRNN